MDNSFPSPLRGVFSLIPESYKFLSQQPLSSQAFDKILTHSYEQLPVIFALIFPFQNLGVFIPV